MADFCRDCSIDIWGEDFGDLSGLITEEDTKNGYVISVLCEECGDIFVDHKGVKVTCDINL